MTATEILKLLRNDGWLVHEQSSSHLQLKHPSRKGRVTIPDQKGDLKRTAIHAIFKQTGGIKIGI
jgi:predicted RNA binding protein YcfA (HicA-like mRNA interferase family)